MFHKKIKNGFLVIFLDAKALFLAEPTNNIGGGFDVLSKRNLRSFADPL